MFMMNDFFSKIVNGFSLLTIFAKKAQSQLFDRVLYTPLGVKLLSS